MTALIVNICNNVYKQEWRTTALKRHRPSEIAALKCHYVVKMYAALALNGTSRAEARRRRARLATACGICESYLDESTIEI